MKQNKTNTKTASTTKRSWGKYVQAGSDSFVEQFRDVGQSAMNSLKEDLLLPTSKDVFGQPFGFERPKATVSGEIIAGQTIEIASVVEQERVENKTLRAQILRERQLKEEDRVATEHKTQRLKLQLQAITSEVVQLATATKNLSEEVKITAMEAPVDPGIYHMVFFERLLSFIKSFRKRIENASLWLASQNQISAKKRRFWGQVGLSGAKRLLSSEDYMIRSAG